MLQNCHAYEWQVIADVEDFRAHRQGSLTLEAAVAGASARHSKLSGPRRQNFAIAMTRNVRGWPGEMLLSPSAEAQ